MQISVNKCFFLAYWTTDKAGSTGSPETLAVVPQRLNVWQIIADGFLNCLWAAHQSFLTGRPQHQSLFVIWSLIQVSVIQCLWELTSACYLYCTWLGRGKKSWPMTSVTSETIRRVQQNPQVTQTWQRKQSKQVQLWPTVLAVVLYTSVFSYGRVD